MTEINRQAKNGQLDMVEQVDQLTEEVRTLALNLAIHLAKQRSDDKSGQLGKLEPQFIRLVNGTVHAVQQLTTVLDAARHEEKMIYDPPSGAVQDDHVEVRLRAILEECSRILQALESPTDTTG
jgi:hypothetical protein